MSDFTVVQINVHEFTPCFLILHNHDEADKDKNYSLFGAMDFIHVSEQKIKENQ